MTLAAHGRPWSSSLTLQEPRNILQTCQHSLNALTRGSSAAPLTKQQLSACQDNTGPLSSSTNLKHWSFCSPVQKSHGRTGRFQKRSTSKLQIACSWCALCPDNPKHGARIQTHARHQSQRRVALRNRRQGLPRLDEDLMLSQGLERATTRQPIADETAVAVIMVSLQS